jgi:hypothetical protein
MPDDLADLLGSSPADAPRRRAADVRSDRLAAQRALLADRPATTMYSLDEHEALENILADGDAPSTAALKRPMTVTNIATILGKEPRRVVGLLSKCPVAGHVPSGRHAGQPMYDLKDAINFLAAPSTAHISTWIKSQSPATLPPFINKAFWEAERVKMKVKYEAGELWHTTQVQRVFGETAKILNEAMKLWVERLPGVMTMTTEQYNSIQDQVDELRNEIYQCLVENPGGQRVRSYAGDIEDLENEGVADDLDGLLA